MEVLESAPVYEADTVDVTFSSGAVLRVRWSLVGELEGISVELDPGRLDSQTLHEVDVSHLARWSAAVGAPTVELRTAWYRASVDLPELVWAISLVTPNGGLTVALGEEHEGELRYLPTSVIALTPGQARSYVPPGDVTSAWGHKSCDNADIPE
jgi:hypothetical protein